MERSISCVLLKLMFSVNDFLDHFMSRVARIYHLFARDRCLRPEAKSLLTLDLSSVASLLVLVPFSCDKKVMEKWVKLQTAKSEDDKLH